MMFALKVVILSVVAVLAMQTADIYGGIWDSQSNPTPNVEVRLVGGAVIKGDLSRNWDKSWQITAGDGSTVRFTEFAMMAVDAKPREGSHWRSMLVMGLVLAAIHAGAYLLFVKQRSLRKANTSA